MNLERGFFHRIPAPSIWHLLGGATILALAILIWILSQKDFFSPAWIAEIFESARRSPWAWSLVLLVFCAGGILFFPVSVLSLATAAAFGPLWGTIYGLSGAVLSASLLFLIGHLAGIAGLRNLLDDRLPFVESYFGDSGMVGAAMIRFAPVAPFSLVNLTAGISSVRFFDFLIGTLLGLTPTFIVKGFVGDSLGKSLLRSHPHAWRSLMWGILAWLTLAGLSFLLARKWQSARNGKKATALDGRP